MLGDFVDSGINDEVVPARAERFHRSRCQQCHLATLIPSRAFKEVDGSADYILPRSDFMNVKDATGA
jgi:CxxC motif-containing protein (DUF1111 family)